jgi:diguanylate cyclase (GGDEF)-like protein
MFELYGTADGTATADLDSSILIVDDDPGLVQVMNQILSEVGNLRFATNGPDALRLARESAPDLILLDAEMPGMSGFQLFEALRLAPELANVPVIFITGHSEPDFEVSALEMGAVDFIVKPFTASLVRARVRTQLRVQHMAAKLSRIALTDSLTGVANRLQFDDMLQREWRRCRRGGDPLSLLLVDVDHFKAYNETHGRPAGDAALQRVADALALVCRRPADVVARCGGDELMVMLPQTDRNGAWFVAHAILEAVGALAIPHGKSPTHRNLTVSIGIGAYDELSACWAVHGPDLRRDSAVPPSPCEATDLVLAADQALRLAKRVRRAQAGVCDISSVGAQEPARAGAPAH